MLCPQNIALLHVLLPILEVGLLVIVFRLAFEIKEFVQRKGERPNTVLAEESTSILHEAEAVVANAWVKRDTVLKISSLDKPTTKIFSSL